MRPILRHQTWIVLLGVFVFFLNLGSASLFDMDEALYGSCAREMAARGDWVVPWFNGQMFPDKPPLMFWLMILCTKIFGATEFALRVHSAVFAIGTALVTYHLGRLLFGPIVGFWSGLIVSTSIIFTVSARAATVDSALTFAIALAILIVVRAGRISQPGRETALGGFSPGGWLSFVLMYTAVGVAVLAKGPVGAIMPLCAIGLFLMIVNRPAPEELPEGRQVTWLAALLRMPLDWLARHAPRPLARLATALYPTADLLGLLTPGRFFRAAWQMRPLTGLLVLSVVAVPWYVLVGMRTDGQWLYQFMAKYNLGPFVKPILGHTGPFYYHFLVILIGFFPWSVFLGPTIVEVFRRLRQRDPARVGLVLVTCWATVVIGFWSIVAMKLPHHILPAYPALALLTATFVYSWIAEPARFSHHWMRSATITLIVVGVGIIVALPIVANFVLPGEGYIGLVGLTLIVGGSLCVYFNRRGRT
ncbi:MAG: glycosyltransferase family 39 protein, partial [Pirellulales bacterium]|nr:glycosyltransferase family 39 protein [Pirellulales bacterium]